MRHDAPSRSWTRLRWFAAFAVVTGVAAACATADTTDDLSRVDGGVRPSDGGTKDAADTLEAAPACGDASPANTCAAPVDLGTIALGDSKTVDVTIDPKSDALWFKITFDKLDALSAHPHVTLDATAASVLQLQIAKSCAGEPIFCGDEDAASTSVAEFESSYSPEAGADPDATGDDSGASDAGVFAPITLGPGGVVYVHVFRKAGAPGPCAPMTLKVSN
jgi:hypothetical protein